MMLRVSMRMRIGLALLLVTACGGGERNATGPAPVGPPPPTVRTLTIHTTVAPEDASLAASLGWTNGIPGALVHLLRTGTNVWETGTTNSSGVVEFLNFLPGSYRIYAGRTLSAAEAQAIGEPIRAFGDGNTVAIGAGEVEIELSLLADRPPGLLISEIGFWTPPVQETGTATYAEAVYFEIYNASSGTIFLDGKTFSVSFFTRTTNPTPCSQTLGARTDPGGVYVGQVLQFPGGGAEYPILPGEAKVVPVSAIDHTPIHPELWDFSNADFEIRGAAAADNPTVPDMLDIGLEPFVIPFAGISLTSLSPGNWVYVLADSFDPQNLPILLRDGNGRGFVRVPPELLLDVMSTTNLRPDGDGDFRVCSPTVHPDFDRYEGGFFEIGILSDRVSYQRRVLRHDQHPILQDTNTSAFDLVLQTPTPGTPGN